MTLRHKIGITGGVLLVVVIVGFVALLDQPEEPEPPFDAEFLRYEGNSNVVVRIVSKSNSRLSFMLYRAGLENEAPISAESLLDAGAIRDFKVGLVPDLRSTEPTKLGMIGVLCVRSPSKFQLQLRRLRHLVPIRNSSPQSERWDIVIDLPAPNGGMP